MENLHLFYANFKYISIKLLILYFNFFLRVQSIIGATEIRGFNDSSGCINGSRIWTRKERAALYEFCDQFTNALPEHFNFNHEA